MCLRKVWTLFLTPTEQRLLQTVLQREKRQRICVKDVDMLNGLLSERQSRDGRSKSAPPEGVLNRFSFHLNSQYRPLCYFSVTVSQRIAYFIIAYGCSVDGWAANSHPTILIFKSSNRDLIALIYYLQ